MANVPVSPNVDRFPTRAGATYRLVGVASNAVADMEIATLLGQLGLRSGSVWGASAPAQAIPADWPTEGRPSVLVGEHLFRAQGTWQSTNALPTTLRLSDGTRAVIFQVWEVPSGLQTIALDNGQALTGNAVGSPNKTLLAGSLVLAAGLFLGGLALVWNRKQAPGALRKNPVRFEGTVHHRGVPLHVHQRDNGFCVDYSAVERYTPFGTGGTICASSRARAITAAQRVIDPWLTAPGATRRKIYVD